MRPELADSPQRECKADDIADLPVADEAGGQPGYHVEKVDESYEPQPDWNLPREIS